jgi:hypothetical protein
MYRNYEIIQFKFQQISQQFHLQLCNLPVTYYGTWNELFYSQPSTDQQGSHANFYSVADT